MSFLASAATYFSDRHSLDSSLGDGIANIIEFERLDDCSYQFHRAGPCEKSGSPDFNASIICPQANWTTKYHD
jgi:hypothetical protein